jgi:hypothetical protein
MSVTQTITFDSAEELDNFIECPDVIVIDITQYDDEWVLTYWTETVS